MPSHDLMGTVFWILPLTLHVFRLSAQFTFGAGIAHSTLMRRIKVLYRSRGTPPLHNGGANLHQTQPPLAARLHRVEAHDLAKDLRARLLPRLSYGYFPCKKRPTDLPGVPLVSPHRSGLKRPACMAHGPQHVDIRRACRACGNSRTMLIEHGKRTLLMEPCSRNMAFTTLVRGILLSERSLSYCVHLPMCATAQRSIDGRPMQVPWDKSIGIRRICRAVPRLEGRARRLALCC
jgi:hypothetical protein